VRLGSSVNRVLFIVRKKTLAFIEIENENRVVVVHILHRIGRELHSFGRPCGNLGELRERVLQHL